MTETGLKKQIREAGDRIEAAFAEKFDTIEANGEKAFRISETETARVACVELKENDPFFVIEYSNGDDGDRFYPSDYDGTDDLIAAMLAELEN